MKVHGLKKAIAIGILVSFTWTGVSWATTLDKALMGGLPVGANILEGAKLAGIMLSPDKKSIIFMLKYKESKDPASLEPIELNQIFDKTSAEKAQIIQKAATVPPPAAKETGTPAPAEAKVLTPAQAAETGSLLNAVAGPFAALAVTLRAAFLASQTKGIGATNQEGVTNDAKPVADTGAGSQHGNTLGGIRGFANSKNLISEAPAQDNGGESLIGSEAKAQLASQVQGKSLADEFIKTNESRLVKDRVGNNEFRFIVLTDDEQRQMSPGLLMELNSKDVFIKNSAGYFVEGQEKVVRSGATIQSIFVVSRYHAYFLNVNAGVLNIYSAKEGK